MKARLFAILHALGLTRLAAWVNRERTVILCYHGVTARATPDPEDPAGLHVQVERFARQLDYLRKHFRVISLEEYLAARRAGKRLPAYSVVLTFDDGYRNFLTAAAPCLRERGLAATVFLVTGRMAATASGRGAAWSPADDRECLTWEEVRALSAEALFRFGSHTRSHPKLAEVPHAQAEDEMRSSHGALRDRLGEARWPFAFPYGSYTPALTALAPDLGHTCALTTDGGANDPDQDLYCLRRTLVGNGDDIPAFAMRVSQLAYRLGSLRGGS